MTDRKGRFMACSRRISALLSGIALLLVQPMLAQTPGAWSLAGNMSTARIMPTLAVLPDGTVLAAGGSTSTNADIYNPTTNTWSATGPMTTARQNQAGTVLADGRVLVAGGLDANGNTLASAEIYDPSTQTWMATGSMNTPRYLFSASLLPNGQVLVAGGWPSNLDLSSQPQYPLTSSELWNPATGQWTLTGSMANPHANQLATLLSNGNVLIAGGENYYQGSGPGTSADAELYNASTGSWSSLPPMSTPRDYAGAALMSNGQLLVAGGNRGGCCAGLQSAEVFDPAALTWTALPAMTTGRQGAPAAAILSGNQVLVSAGYSCCEDPYTTRPSTEFYDLTTQQWHLTGSLNTPRAYHSAITLPDGTVLAVGGYFEGSSTPNLASAERYYPSSSTQTVTVELVGTIAPTSFSVAGTGCSPGTYSGYPNAPVNWTPGSSCQVDVLPPSGYSFTSWSDGSTANPRTFVAPTTTTIYTATIVQGGSGGSSGPAAIQAIGGAHQNTTVNTAFAKPLSIRVTDSSGNGVSGVTVTFTAPSSGASGTFSGGVNTATTNSSGVATSAVFTANGISGSYTVVASVAGLSSTASFSLHNK